MIDHEPGWATNEFQDVNLGDKRLNKRLMKLCDRFADAPESPINQACDDFAETKAAYRFFQNDSVDADEIIKTHSSKTARRADSHKTVLALQDTSYFVYTKHPKTTGLGKISMQKGRHVSKIYSHGLIMHACLAVTTNGLPLGLLDQKIFTRKPRLDDKLNKMEKSEIYSKLPVEEKESYRWIESLEATSNALTKANIVTVCDRECDFYDFYRSAQHKDASVLVRASKKRRVNKTSRYGRKAPMLWELIESQPCAGSYNLDVPYRKNTRHSNGRTAHSAQMKIKFGEFKLNPPSHHPQYESEVLSDMKLYAVYAYEKNPLEGEPPVEWMLVTNQPVNSFEEARERVRWYSLRWKIEMYFKVLKSGLRVEDCRLETADRLTRYLSVMSVVAWRLFSITLIARTNPSLPSSDLLSPQEIKVLEAKATRKGQLPKPVATIAEAVILIARLGGYLARRSDPPPGTLVLWRGWKRLISMTEGWCLAIDSETYG